MKRKAVTCEEQDVVYARRWYCYLQRAGATSSIKRGMRRRERREGQQDAREQLRDWEAE